MDRRIFAVVLAFIVFSTIVFVLYQQQESLVPDGDFGPASEDEIYDEEYYSPVVQGSILAECGTQETQYKRDMCWKFDAFDAMDPGFCLNIENYADRVICVRTIARGTQGGKGEMLAVCNDYLSDDDFQRYRCQAEVAKELLDYSICDAMPFDYKAICVSLVDAENPYPGTGGLA